MSDGRPGENPQALEFGPCCSGASALFLDIHTAKHKGRCHLTWGMAEAMNEDPLALRVAGRSCYPARFLAMKDSYARFIQYFWSRYQANRILRMPQPF